ncbi:MULTISPECIES: hypothetical protein [Acinetobacter calcoaceticus/baumannii complex]|uniref:hypothetical protein n=1 Tax=Acinetobacter calcoaceticus/baumannii complex TaxID=909768 RepID=UPI001EEBC181|nr:MULTISPECIES: hypothetical protein [Acinetobacter calcoaceticus/baumannii complex]MDN8180423.1 hypothetical protein [Acinetobacter baumannii]MDV4239036.1 hypothetical protein [Acinetobacter baumannii]
MGNLKFYAQIPEAAYRAQELFFHLGYVWHDTKCQTITTFDGPCWYSSFEDGDLACDTTDVNHAHQEVSIQALQEMVALKQNVNQGLISNLEAFTAWLNGSEVEFLYNDQVTLIDADTPLDIFLTSHGFRLKQKTIKLELEIPRPFKPQKGEKYWFMSPFHNTGYDYHTYTDDLVDKFRIQYGAYRTEEEMKQVVAAWRNSIKELNNAK